MPGTEGDHIEERTDKTLIGTHAVNASGSRTKREPARAGYLSVRSTVAPRRRVTPGLGLWTMTLEKPVAPLRTCLTAPKLHPLRRSNPRAAGSDLPRSFGTTQCGSRFGSV